MPPKVNRQFALIWWLESLKKDVVALNLIPKNKRKVGEVVNLTWEEFKTKQKTKERAKVVAISENEKELHDILLTDTGELHDPENKIFSAEILTEKKKTAEHKKQIKSAQKAQKRQIEQVIKSQRPIFDKENFTQDLQKNPKVPNSDTVLSTSDWSAPPHIFSQTPEQFSYPGKTAIPTGVPGPSLSHPYSISNFLSATSSAVSATPYHCPPLHTPSQSSEQFNKPEQGSMTTLVHGSLLTGSQPNSNTVASPPKTSSSTVPATSYWYPPPHVPPQASEQLNQPKQGAMTTMHASSHTSSSTVTAPSYWYPPPHVPPQASEQLNQPEQGAMTRSVHGSSLTGSQPNSDTVSSPLSTSSSTVPAPSYWYPPPYAAPQAFEQFNQPEQGAVITSVHGSLLTGPQPNSNTVCDLSNQGQQILNISATSSTVTSVVPRGSTLVQSYIQPENVDEMSDASTSARLLVSPYICSEACTPFPENDNGTSQNSFSSRETSDNAGKTMLDGHIPWKVTDRDVEFLEGLLESVKKRLAEQKNESYESQKPLPLSPEYFEPGTDKEEISPNCGFYLQKSKVVYIKFLFEAADHNWKVLVRETLLEVYGADIGQYSATGKRGDRPAVNYKLFRALFEWVNKLCLTKVDKKAYVDLINKVTYNKRRCLDSKPKTNKRSKKIVPNIPAAPCSTITQSEEENLDHTAIADADIEIET